VADALSLDLIDIGFCPTGGEGWRIQNIFNFFHGGHCPKPYEIYLLYFEMPTL
jgi:hypothetical protein